MTALFVCVDSNIKKTTIFVPTYYLREKCKFILGYESDSSKTREWADIFSCHTCYRVWRGVVACLIVEVLSEPVS